LAIDHPFPAAVGVAKKMEMIMEKTFDNSVDELIDLGSVSQETRGISPGLEDTLGGQHAVTGLSDD